MEDFFGKVDEDLYMLVNYEVMVLYLLWVKIMND